MKDQSNLMETQSRKTFLQLIEAIPASVNQYLAYALNMRLSEVAYFYGHLQLKKSKTISVWDFFKLVKSNGLLNIFLQYTVFCYSSSKVKFSPCPTG